MVTSLLLLGPGLRVEIEIVAKVRLPQRIFMYAGPNLVDVCHPRVIERQVLLIRANPAIVHIARIQKNALRLEGRFICHLERIEFGGRSVEIEARAVPADDAEQSRVTEPDLE